MKGETAIRLPVNGRRLIACFRKNDMFVIGMTRDDLMQAIQSGDTVRISQHLYRTQKISSRDYNFRLHTASTIENDEELVRVQSFGIFSEETAPIPVEVNSLGQVKIINYDD